MKISVFLKLEITNHLKKTFVGDKWKINCQKYIVTFFNRMLKLSVRIKNCYAIWFGSTCLWGFEASLVYIVQSSLKYTVRPPSQTTRIKGNIIFMKSGIPMLLNLCVGVRVHARMLWNDSLVHCKDLSLEFV